MKRTKKETLIKVVFALVGIFLVGTGVAFNSCALLGNDPIGIVYDGVRNVAHLSSEQLGMASNIVNIVLIALMVVVGRRYVNIGTLVYILPYGFFVSAGTRLCRMMEQALPLSGLPMQILTAVIGCTLLYIGVGIYIATDMGLDPFTGLVMVIADAVEKEYRIVKILFDFSMVIIGVVLGGKLGVITIITALTAGPCIQFFANRIQVYIIDKVCLGCMDSSPSRSEDQAPSAVR